MNDQYLARVAERFWTLTGSASPPFPRVLSDWLPNHFPAFVVPIPGLTIDRAQQHLLHLGINVRLVEPDRRLHGCAVARGGFPVILVDGADPADQREFTVAHEIAHLILDYYEPMRRAKAELGSDIGPVFDGLRPPTWDERVAAALAGSPLRLFVHLMARDHDLQPSAAIAEREILADQLACELLAPAADVRRRLADDAPPFTAIDDVLVESFGLPRIVATEYGRYLNRLWLPPPTFVDWLRPRAVLEPNGHR